MGGKRILFDFTNLEASLSGLAKIPVKSRVELASYTAFHCRKVRSATTERHREKPLRSSLGSRFVSARRLGEVGARVHGDDCG